MKNINGTFEVNPMIRPDGRVVCLVTRLGNSHILNHFELEGVRAESFGTLIQNTEFTTRWDMGDWELEIAQTDDEARVYVLAWDNTDGESTSYTEVDERGRLHW